MSHKVHPKAFRVKGMDDFHSRGFYGKQMSQFLEEDFIVKEFLRKKLADASIANIIIEHSANTLHVIIETARPGIIIGRGGGGVEILKTMVEKKLARKTDSLGKPLSQRKKNIKIEIREIKNPWTSAALVAQMAAQQVERRIPFRQVLKKSIERVMQNKEIKGIRIEVAGRLNGVEIARKEWLRQGRLPRQTIRADIDYAQTQAYCTYGVIGVKVWMYKGETFE